MVDIGSKVKSLDKLPALSGSRTVDNRHGPSKYRIRQRIRFRR
jgi:hypothetical protein